MARHGPGFGRLDSNTNRNLAHSLAKTGRTLGVRRGRTVFHPGFQFDEDTGQVRHQPC